MGQAKTGTDPPRQGGESATEPDVTEQVLEAATEADTVQPGVPLLQFQRTLGQGAAAALSMQYAVGRSALEVSRIAIHQYLAWVGAMTATDQQAARRTVETGVDVIEAGVAESERTATESVETSSDIAADLADTYAASMESAFDAFLETAAPLGHPPVQRP